MWYQLLFLSLWFVLSVVQSKCFFFISLIIFLLWGETLFLLVFVSYVILFVIWLIFHLSIYWLTKLSFFKDSTVLLIIWKQMLSRASTLLVFKSVVSRMTRVLASRRTFFFWSPLPRCSVVMSVNEYLMDETHCCCSETVR